MPPRCSMPTHRAFAVFAVLLAMPSPARSQDARMELHREKGNPPITLNRTGEEGVVSGQLVEDVTAHVKSVELGKRLVTLRLSGGREETMVAGPEVKNLEKLERGDRVTIRYRAGLVLRLKAPGTEDVSPEVSKQTQRTGRGDVLSGVETVRATIPVTVAAIAPESRIVTLRDADGRTYRVTAGPGVSLDRVKVGDRFSATYSAAMAVSVQPTYRE